MTRTLNEIERDWLGGERVQLPADDVLRAFSVAEQTRGREWVLSTTTSPGGGRVFGFAPFLQVYGFGKRFQAVQGSPGADALLTRLLQNDAAAESELTAIYLLRSRRFSTDVEIGPEVTVGERHRHPDFRIRSGTAPWTYTEVTQLNRSAASARTHEVIRRIADRVILVDQPFVLEVVFWRDPSEAEEDEIIRRQARRARRLTATDAI